MVSGAVVDAAGDPLPGVQVTLAGERIDMVFRTEGDGNYRFALVPPGPYALEAALSGFGTREMR